MLRQDPDDAQSRILVEEAFDALNRLVQRPRHRVDSGERQQWIGGGERANLRPVPLTDLAFRQGHELDA
jgi:hypothetical protein